jgi:hypothetical protein
MQGNAYWEKMEIWNMSCVEMWNMSWWVTTTSGEKDMGVFFSNNCKPTLNCGKVSKAANKVVGLIRRNISKKKVKKE